MWGGTQPAARRSLSQPTADSSLYAREPAPLPPPEEAFPVGEGDLPAGERSSGAGLNFQGSPPHPARATPGPSSPSRRGLEPLIRHALRRATFPAGEGCLPAGEHSSGPGLNFRGSPPHPARATPGPPSPSRRGLEPLIRHALRRATLSVGEGCLRRGKAQRAFFWPLRFLALYGTMSKNRQAPGGKGGFFCPVSRPSRPLWSPL